MYNNVNRLYIVTLTLALRQGNDTASINSSDNNVNRLYRDAIPNLRTMEIEDRDSGFCDVDCLLPNGFMIELRCSR